MNAFRKPTEAANLLAATRSENPLNLAPEGDGTDVASAGYKKNTAATIDQAEILLSVSRAIAAIRERKELFATIIEKIKPVIPVDDTGILILDKTDRYYQDWTNVDNYQETPGVVKVQHLGYDQFLPVDRWFEYAQHRTEIMSVASFIENYPEHAFGPFMWEAGLREFIFTPLIYGGKKLGILIFDSEKEGIYTQAHIPLFKAIADLIATAVANILANEEIMKEKSKNETLFQISQAIATIQKKEDLLRVMFQKIQPVFGFYDIGLAIISQENNTVTDWAALIPELSPSDANKALHAAQLFTVPYRDSAIESISHAVNETGGAVILKIDADSLTKYPDFREILEIELAHGYKEMWFTNLKTGGKLLGTLNFNSLEQAYFTRFDPNFFRAVADQVAVAVANILANEELEGKTQEKSLLLEISKSIASIQGKVQLLQTINAKLKPIFKFEDTGLFIINEVENYHYDITVQHPDIDDSNLNRRLSENLNQLKIPHRGTAVAANYDELKESDSPIIVDFKDLFGRYPHPFANIILEDGFIETMAGLLCVGGEPFGILYLNSKEAGVLTKKSFPLFKAITDQIAVAVANILANEEILEREREKTLLLSISEAIATVRSKEDILRLIVQKVKPLFKFYDCGILIINSNNRYNDLTVLHPKIDNSPNNYLIQDRSYYDFGGIDFTGSHLEWLVSLIEKAQAPILFDWQADYTRFHDAPLLENIRQLGYAESLVSTLKIGGTVFGCFFINYMQLGQAQSISHTLFQNLINQLSVAISNILANEEILEREKEKAILLSISEDIAAVRNKEELLQLIIGKIKPLFHFYDCGILVIDNSGLYHDLAAIHPAIDHSEVNNYLNQRGFYKQGGIT